MNNRQLYLAWLRTAAPAVYVSALRRALGKNRSLGGLTDDLVQQSFAPATRHSFLGDDTTSMIDPITVSAISTDQPITTNYSFSSEMPAFDPNSVTFNPVSIDSGTAAFTPGLSIAPAQSNSIFGNILTAVTAIGAGVLNASNQSKLISLNTTRAQQGLPPVNAAGQVIRQTGTSTTGSALLAFERSISGASGSSMLPLLGIAGLAALFFFRKRTA